MFIGLFFSVVGFVIAVANVHKICRTVKSAVRSLPVVSCGGLSLAGCNAKNHHPARSSGRWWRMGCRWSGCAGVSRGNSGCGGGGAGIGGAGRHRDGRVCSIRGNACMRSRRADSPCSTVARRSVCDSCRSGANPCRSDGNGSRYDSSALRGGCRRGGQGCWL